MNVKYDALKADSWAERQMDKDSDRGGVAVHKQCRTCSVFPLRHLLVMLTKIKRCPLSLCVSRHKHSQTRRQMVRRSVQVQQSVKSLIVVSDTQTC